MKSLHQFALETTTSKQSAKESPKSYPPILVEEIKSLFQQVCKNDNYPAFNAHV